MKEFLQKLICTDSTAAKGELAAAEVIADEFAKSDIDASIDTWESNRANVVAQIASGGRRGGLLFACHMDVVPAGDGKWQVAPFSGIEQDGKIYGRGSADMKGPIAAIVSAIRQLVDTCVELKGDITFLAAAGEETDSCGVKRFMRDRSSIGELVGVVVPEPTDFDIVTGHRGLLWLKVTTKGRTAHGSMPQLGINAIESMRVLLGALEEYKKRMPAGCSMSVNTIAGGKAVNVVPDMCSVEIDIRTPAGQRHLDIITEFENILAGLKRENSQFEAAVSVVRDVGPLEADNQSAFVKDFCLAVEIKETKTVGFCTDGPFLADLGVPIVIFGPGKSDLCHQPNEYIEMADLEKAVEYYKKIILKFLA